VTAKGPMDDPRLPAACDVLRRTGARQVQIRYSDDEQPVVWLAVVGWYIGRDGRPVAAARDARRPGLTYETAAAMEPLTAVFRLCDQVVDGGTCTHCGRHTGFSPNPEAMPLDELICWWIWDPEVDKFVQGCQLEPQA
jgi:hypothetical protein